MIGSGSDRFGSRHTRKGGKRQGGGVLPTAADPGPALGCTVGTTVHAVCATLLAKIQARFLSSPVRATNVAPASDSATTACGRRFQTDVVVTLVSVFAAGIRRVFRGVVSRKNCATIATQTDRGRDNEAFRPFLPLLFLLCSVLLWLLLWLSEKETDRLDAERERLDCVDSLLSFLPTPRASGGLGEASSHEFRLLMLLLLMALIRARAEANFGRVRCGGWYWWRWCSSSSSPGS
mmetsp:Transcript_31372/g.65816  ORF Transcript_31372/g.65816 Transcript_31372/m.65816 type:complete len:235 (+) Transcript_31372:1823-2527(+)